MRQLKLLSVAIMAVLSLGVAAVATAQAAPLLDLLPEGANFSFKSIGKTTLLTLSGKKVECLSVTGTGKGETARLGKATFVFTDCLEPTLKVKCTGLGDTEGNITVTGEYHIRHLLNPEEAFVNLAILIPAAQAAHFSCFGILYVVKGCVASMDLLTKEAGANVVNLLLKTIFVDFLNESPINIDTDNSLGMEACELKSKEGGNAEETAGQIGKGEIEKCEKLATECTFLIDLSGVQ